MRGRVFGQQAAGVGDALSIKVRGFDEAILRPDRKIDDDVVLNGKGWAPRDNTVDLKEGDRVTFMMVAREADRRL